jgi:PAS domain S-box-containing protein
MEDVRMIEHAVKSSAQIVYSAEIVLDVSEKKPIRVLHVDDELGFLKVARHCLEMQGPFRVDTASCVEEALEKMKKEKYDAVVSDYQMPREDGLQFLTELRQSGNTVPFIMFTGRGGEEVAIEALNLGADQYLSKAGDPETVYSQLGCAIRRTVEKRKAEEELRESEEKFRTIFNEAMDAIFVADAETGIIIDCNQVAAELVGRAKSELIGKHLRILHSEIETENGRFSDTFQQHIGEREGQVLETKVIRKNGEIKEVAIKGNIIELRGRRVLQGIFRDITEQKKDERKALENQENFRALFSGNPEAAVHVGPDFCILDVNPRFEMLFGYKLDEIKGRNINDVVVQKDKIEEAQMLDRKAEQDKHVSQATVRRKKDGSLVSVFVSAAPITVEGRFLGYVAVYKDISELKNTQKKLEIMNEKLRVIGGLTRHDVRNKLSAITGNAYLLRKELAGDKDVIDKLRDMENAVQQTIRIFDFAKAYEMLGAEELGYVKVEKTFDEALSLFSGPINVKVANECHGLTVLADSLLRQLFYNLIDNSLKHGQKTTRIRVYCEETCQDHVRLVYEDDGVGILASKKQKLFKEGYSTGGSTGYGLYLIGKLMEVYGWTIEETGTPGREARFTMVIPKINQNGKESYRLH